MNIAEWHGSFGVKNETTVKTVVLNLEVRG